MLYLLSRSSWNWKKTQLSGNRKYSFFDEVFWTWRFFFLISLILSPQINFFKWLNSGSGPISCETLDTLSYHFLTNLPCVCTHTHTGILLSHKKEQNSAICNNMDGSRDHTKWSKSDKDKYNITYMWYLKYDANEHIYETETNSQIQKINLWLPKGKEGRER